MHQMKLRSLACAGILLIGTAMTTDAYAQSDADILDAAAAGNAGMIQTLLQLQANPNAVDSMGYSAVMYAAQSGYTDVVRVLLDAGADVNAISSEGWTALLLTALQGQAETATELMARGADATITFGGGFTALMVASARGHAEVAAALLEGGLDVEATLSDGRTSLMAAAEGGHVEVINTLIERGANVNARANGGSTAAMAALRNGHLEAAKELADAGAEFMAGLPSVESPTEPACPRPQWPESVWEADITGQIVVEFVVDVEGLTEDSTVTLISTPHPDLEEAAKVMFQGCEFNPGHIEGTPVRVRLRQGFAVGG